MVWPGTRTSEAGKGKEGSVVGSRARMGGGVGTGGALEAAARLLGLRGLTARVGGGNGDDDAADAADADEEETTSLESSLSSDGTEGFADALARSADT